MHIAPEEMPLRWPDGWPRTAHEDRVRPPFLWGYATTRSNYLHALGELGVSWAQLSLSDDRRDPGVACYWNILNNKCAVAFDLFTQQDGNLDAITRCLEHLAALRDLGGEALLRNTLKGLRVSAAIPDWCTFYGFEEIPERSLLEKTHRDRVFEAHPDRGGTSERMHHLNENIAEAREYYSKHA